MDSGRPTPLGIRIIVVAIFAVLCAAIWNGVDFLWDMFVDHTAFTFDLWRNLIMPCIVGVVVYFVASRK